MNKTALSLTKHYLNSISADFLSVCKVPVTDDLEVEVVKFNSEHNAKLGQTSLFRTILIHDMCFEHPDFLRYVTAHEYGHYKSVFSLVSTWVMLFAWLAGIVTLVWGLFTLQLSILIAGLLFLAAGCVLSWIIEYRAESTALDLIGEKNVKAAHDLMNSVPKPSFIWRIVSQITHPALATTLTIKRWLGGVKE